ncbi:MAG: ATP-binding cassette domain-containing protein [Pseudomonadota bacterium]
MSEPFCVSIKDLEFAWRPGPAVLSVASFNVRRGERVFLYGASGSGKSTLLGLIAGVFSVGRGDLQVLDHSLQTMSGAARDALRADAMGVIFQQFNLVPFLSLVDNVLLPCRFSPARAARTGATPAQRTQAAFALLERLGLAREAAEGRAASALSVGQQQRVAAARALIGAPSLIIADEPTSALDAAARDTFLTTLLEEARQAAVLFVSHDVALAARFDRSASMETLNAAAPGGADDG